MWWSTISGGRGGNGSLYFSCLDFALVYKNIVQ